ncbi:MAG: response regulator [Methanocella sp.]
MPDIAIIDNEPGLAKLYETALASRGHKVAFVVSNCSEALEKLKTMEKTPDMIVVSFDHGSAMLNIIKSEYPSIIIKEVRAKERQ